ncbi:hypothetical protein SDC9_144529 [bioreactor metagenome]|uniref:Uncharacterized protein n=1 Tax=bioreactor metagenome TaxID=1076179 RepID=A0A645E715_9ZZZZ
MLRVAAAEAKPRLFRVIRLELHGRRAGVETADSGHRIFGRFATETRRPFPFRQVGDQRAFRQRKQEFTVRKTAQADAGKLDPFDPEIGASGFRLDPPADFRSCNRRRRDNASSGKRLAFRKTEDRPPVVLLPPDCPEIPAVEPQRIADEVAQLKFEKPRAAVLRGEFHPAEAKRRDFARRGEVQSKTPVIRHNSDFFPLENIPCSIGQIIQTFCK